MPSPAHTNTSVIITTGISIVRYCDNRPGWHMGHSGRTPLQCDVRVVDVSTALSEGLLRQQLIEMGYELVNTTEILNFLFANKDLRAILKGVSKNIQSFFPESKLELWLFNNQEEGIRTLNIRVHHELSPEEAVWQEFDFFNSYFSEHYLAAQGKICLIV